jgi:hypothetical protein
VLSTHDKEIPFVLLYLIDPDRRLARLAGAAGVAQHRDISPAAVDLDQDRADQWALDDAVKGEAMQIVEHLADRFKAVPPGPWSDPPNMAAVVPISSNPPHELAGVMIVVAETA